MASEIVLLNSSISKYGILPPSIITKLKKIPNSHIFQVSNIQSQISTTSNISSLIDYQGA